MMEKFVSQIIPYVTLGALGSSILALFVNIVTAKSAMSRRYETLLRVESESEEALNRVDASLSLIHSDVDVGHAVAKRDAVVHNLNAIVREYEGILAKRKEYEVKRFPMIYFFKASILHKRSVVVNQKIEDNLKKVKDVLYFLEN